MTRLTLALLVAFVPVPFVAAEDASTPPLAKKLEAVMDGPDYKRAHWGVLFVDAKTGETIYSRQPDKLFAPASVTKLFTASAALVTFGPEHTFQTPVYARGEVEKGVLRGDLILVASGDLSFGGRTTKDGKLAFTTADHTYANSGLMESTLTDTNPLAAVEDLARQVKEAGVGEVSGEVLIDDRLFARTRSTGSGPEAVTPIILNDNVIDVIVTPGEKKGAPAKVTVRPESSVVTIDADVDTTAKQDPPLILLSQSAAGQFVVRGRVPAGGKPVVRIIPLDDPASHTRSVFIEALRRAGVKVAAAVARPAVVVLPAATEYANLKAVATHTSAPLGEALKVTLKVSHNLYASTLPCLVAAKTGKATMEDGLRVQRKVLKELGVDTDAVSFGGGAGGSGADFATPKATVQLLQGLGKRKDWPQFRDWLPVLGEDGTLADIGKDGPAKGRVFAKTGTNVWTDALNARPFVKSKALAGVMTTKSGRELYFAVFVNDVPLPPLSTATKVGKVLGHLCEIVHEECK